MQSIPKVSVIIPMLNSKPYICECLDSVVNQTLSDIEILCIDAGSTDGTREILSEYSRKDSRIKIIDSSKKSYGYQVNLGLDTAQGEYIGIVESDDYILNNMYEFFYDIAKKYDLEALKGDFCEFYGNRDDRTFKKIDIACDKKYYGKILSPKKDKGLFYVNMLNPPGIYQLSFLRKHNIRLNESPGASYQDNGLWFQIFMNCQKIYFYPKAFYMLRRDNPNSSVKSIEKVYCLCDEFDYIYNIICNNNEETIIYKQLCAYFRYCTYMWKLYRVDNKYKIEFLMRFSNDFKKIKINNELRKELFDDYSWDSLQLIIDNPELYCARYMGDFVFQYINQEDSNIKSKDELIFNNRILSYLVEATKLNLENKNHELKAVYSSRSFLIGRMITWLPRKLRTILHIGK